MPFDEQDKTTRVLSAYVERLDAKRAEALGVSIADIREMWKEFFRGLGILSADPKESKEPGESS